MNSTISESESEVSSMAWIPYREDLQRYLREGEYPPFRSVAMFESNFIQITRRGKNVDIHNHPTEATIGIISTDNKLPLPNIMLIARPVPMQNGQVPSGCRTEQLVLTRLLPLKFVRISVHDPDRQRIKLKLINGRSYYLQLYASPGEQELLFDRWLSLIYLLHHPPDWYLRPSSCMPRDNLSVQILASEEEEEVVVPGSQNKAQEDADPEEKGQEQVDNAASPLGESSSRVSLAQGPSTETKPELSSESNEHESLTESDVVRHEGDLGERANSSSLHSSTAVDQARENTAVSVLSDTTAKDSNTSSQASGK
ncbi:protein FAM71C-like [Mauremys reevesii]|uniref:protein FAM71C-like n=1 Tax=Mauremys reevesii TaxID=260615 RepID=UPI001940034E|nr:protein FAM71C-like [Mauremys reevesii]